MGWWQRRRGLTQVGIGAVVLLALCLGFLPPAQAASDTTPPVLTGLSYPTAPLDTRTGSAQLTVNLQATDDLSGLKSGDWWAFVDFKSGSGSMAASVDGFISDPASTSTVLTFPRYSPGGTWHLYSVQLRDNAGNWHLYNEAQVQALGFPTTVEVVSETSPTSSSTTTTLPPTTTTTTLPPTTTTTTTTTPTTTTTTTSTTTTTVPPTTTTLPPPTTTTTSTTLPPAPDFVDVGGNIYSTAINGLHQAGIIDGYPGGNGTWVFRPGSLVWRAQFAKVIVGTLSIPVDEGLVAPFSDLGPDDPGNLYPHEYIAAASSYGITNGTAPGQFSPWADITRAQVVTMIVRGAQSLKPGALATPPAGYAGTIPSFSDVHSPNMRIAEYNGLMTGLVGFFPGWDPWAKATRGEVAQLLWNLWQK